jgi:PilZ domain
MCPAFFLTPRQNCAKGSQRHPRLLFSVPVMLYHLVPGGMRFTHGVTLNISEGGLGALVKGSLEVGATVSLEFELPDYNLKAVGIVRHSSSARSGFEFVRLTREGRRRIANLVGSA